MKRLLRRKLVSIAVASCFSTGYALANPTGPQVINGTATFQRPDSSTLSVTNSPGTIINWQGFSIGAGELTRFIQQSPASAVLNRVVGADISQIHGQLLSNGRVFLINPSGIVIGPGAMIDTAGFVASTLNMLDGDFLAGKLKFEGDSASGSIINQGWIRTGYGGHVLLVAPQIENSGLIHTPGGEIILAAGKKLTITSLDLDGVQFEVQAPTDSVLNVGKLLADGGAVGVFAGSLRHSGEIRANALVYDEAGRIVLKAQDEIQVAAGSTTSADGKIGGDITIQSGGMTRVAGSVSARGTEGGGGTVQVLGDLVGVIDGAIVDASGGAAGGTVLVGGDLQGGNPAVSNARRTYVGPDAVIRADALAHGDGGRVIVWSDDTTAFYGAVSARGGAASGDGGFAEISGKESLVFRGSVDLSAPQGKAGNLLLDPNNITVSAGGTGTLAAAGDANANNVLEFLEGGGTASDQTIDAAAITTLTSAGTNVTLQANTDITVNQSVLSGGTGGLTLHAGDDILINQVVSVGGPLVMVAGHSSGIPTGAAADTGNNIIIGANVFSGPQTIQALNDVRVIADDAAVNVFAIGPQTVNAGGAVIVQGSATGSNRFAQFTTTGEQTFSASSISLMGGSGTNNFAQINHQAGSIGNQTIDVTGPIAIAGGVGVTNNFAQITNSTGLQSVTAESITLTGAVSGTSSFANIRGANQLITTTGDVTLFGSAADLSNARIGGLGLSTATTDLVLNVGGNLTLNGGIIGANVNSAQTTNIAITAGGDVTLTPGVGFVPRIGFSSSNMGDGVISVAAGGNIALNSSGIGAGSSINTLGSVALSTLTPEKTITQGADSAIRADSLAATANGDISLNGANQVTIFSGAAGLGGNMSFRNSSSALTVPGLTLFGGSLAINHTGNLFITGDISSGAQTIRATGDITVAPFTGPGARLAASGHQTIDAGGNLLVLGGTGPGGIAAVRGSSGQSISAAGILVAGGSGGNSRFAEIRQTGSGSNQVITVTNGGTLELIGSTSGLDNFAQVRNDGVLQLIDFSGGGGITLTGGSGPDGPSFPGDTANNFARILSNDSQLIHTGSITLNGGVAGVNNFTVIQAPNQLISTTADVTLHGGPAENSGSRIGSLAGGTTDLVLNVGGNLTLNGGTGSLDSPSLGANRVGGQTTNILVTAAGDITLNPGSVPNANPRIGSPEVNVAGGDIHLHSTGGNISFNSAGTDFGTAVRTTGNVVLSALSPGKGITQGADSLIRADGLSVTANGDITLGGANTVGIFNGFTGLGGNLTLNNSSPNLTVTGIDLLGGGALVLNQNGNLFVTGGISSGPQVIHAGGNFTISPFGAPGLTVSATGAQTISADGTLELLGGSGLDSFVRAVSNGPTNITAGNDIVLTGGTGSNAHALLFGGSDINLTVGGALRLTQGAGNQAWARIQTMSRDSAINVFFPNLASGGYFVNDVDGAIRRGLTGFLSGDGAAVLDQTLNVTYGQ